MKPRPHIYKKLLAAAWFLLTTWLLVMPGNALPKSSLIQIPFFDKWVHAGLLGILTLLLLNAFRAGSAWGIVFAVILYGIAIEFVQLYLAKNRSFEVWDIAADAAGALLALAVYRWCTQKKHLR